MSGSPPSPASDPELTERLLEMSERMGSEKEAQAHQQYLQSGDFVATGEIKSDPYLYRVRTRCESFLKTFLTHVWMSFAIKLAVAASSDRYSLNSIDFKVSPILTIL